MMKYMKKNPKTKTEKRATQKKKRRFPKSGRSVFLIQKLRAKL